MLNKHNRTKRGKTFWCKQKTLRHSFNWKNTTIPTWNTWIASLLLSDTVGEVHVTVALSEATSVPNRSVLEQVCTASGSTSAKQNPLTLYSWYRLVWIAWRLWKNCYHCNAAVYILQDVVIMRHLVLWRDRHCKGTIVIIRHVFYNYSPNVINMTFFIWKLI